MQDIDRIHIKENYHLWIQLNVLVTFPFKSGKDQKGGKTSEDEILLPP